MTKRNYNVFFNTHTVSGIVISVALYIIFFAGAFALFKDEIKVWEDATPISHIEKQHIDFDGILQKLNEDYDLRSRDVQLRFGVESDEISVFMSAQKDTLAETVDDHSTFLYLDTKTLETKSYEEQYSLGEFLYRLHFFQQIPIIGIYLAGFVALFFLFAIVTGIIVHWKKIIPNFYHFNPKSTLKRVWTDSHTALGVIGLPYQFMFAVTGAYFGLSILVLLPANFLYGGDQDKLIADMRPDVKSYEWIAPSNEKMPCLNTYVIENTKKWDNYTVTRAFIKNYGGTNMKYVLLGELHAKERFIGLGRIIYNPYTSEIEDIKKPGEFNYLEDSQRLMGRLHFANYGGVSMKISYFILAFITCFVILTGVLIWIEARNKKSMTFRQRLHTAKVGHIYLAICLTMFPVTALSFLFVKFTNGYFVDKQTAIYTFFFIVWLAFILFFRYKRNNYVTNRTNLLLGSIFGFLIPITNGILHNNWIWNTYKNHQIEIFTIDILWIFLSIIGLLVYIKIKPNIQEKSAFTKYPIDYRNRKKLLAEEAKKLNKNLLETENIEDKNHIPMRTKIVILWILLGIGWIIHHMYGLFNIYYNETLVMEGATGEAPFIHHIYRILFEGLCLFFGLLTIEVSKKWFKITSLIWASIAGLYNVYHFVTALIFEGGNISEIFMLLLMVITSIFLIKNLNNWRK